MDFWGAALGISICLISLTIPERKTKHVTPAALFDERYGDPNALTQNQQDQQHNGQDGNRDDAWNRWEPLLLVF